MRHVRWAIGIVSLGSAGAILAGCIGGDDSSAPAPSIDAAIPQLDSSIPRVDGGGDAAVPDATTNDATTNDVTVADTGGGDSTVEDAPSTDAPSDVNTADTADTNVPDTAPSTARIRVGWFLPPVQGGKGGRPMVPAGGNAGTYDVCVAPHGTGLWQGPLLAAAGGLPAYSLTAYDIVPAGQYDVRIVFTPAGGDASAATCNDVPDAGPDAGDGGAPADYTSLPPLPAGASVTLAFLPPVVGTSQPQVVPLTDEATPTAGKVHVRFANMIAGTGGLDFGSGGGALFNAWFKNVDPTEYIDTTAPDPNGYRDVDPNAIDLTIQAGGSDTVVTNGPAPLSAGDIVSAFAVGSPIGVMLLACDDLQPNTTTPQLAQCALVSGVPLAGLAQTRFADFLVDTKGAYDVCVKYHAVPAYGAPFFGTPGIASTTKGMPMSPYLSLHGGFQYDVRFVAAGAADCSSSAFPDATYTAPTPTSAADGFATFAAVGYVSPPDAGAGVGDAGVVTSGDAGTSTPGLSTTALSFLTIPDGPTVPSLPMVRAIHVNGSNPAAITLTEDVLQSSFTFGPMAYGGTATPGGADARGYVTVPVGTMYGNTPNGEYYTPYVVGADDSGAQLPYTVYVFPNDAPNPPGPDAELVCPDSPFTTTPCRVIVPNGG